MSSNETEWSDGSNGLYKTIMEFIMSCNERQFQFLFENKRNLDSINLKMKHDWDKIKSSPNFEESSVTELSSIYTAILKQCLDNQIQLPSCLFESLFYCSKPVYIYKLFNENLINLNHPHNYKHFNILMKGNDDYLFVSLSDIDESTPTYELIMSITVLLYRTKCLKYRDAILKSVNNSFLDFIFYEKYNDDVRRIAIRKFLEALVLNGIFKLNDLSFFLNQTMADITLDIDSNDDSLFSSSDDDDDDGNDRMDVQLQDLDIINHDRTLTIGERLSISNTNYLADYFPLSLKNLCRICIKNYYLVDYNEMAIDRLDIPAVAKKFLLFDDKISDILKLSRQFKYI
jgi:hypothetical protein